MNIQECDDKLLLITGLVCIGDTQPGQRLLQALIQHPEQRYQQARFVILEVFLFIH